MPNLRIIAALIYVLLLCVGMSSAQSDEAPDSTQWITYISDHQLYKMRPDGSDVQLISEMSVSHAVWSSDGEWVIVISSEGVSTELPGLYYHFYRMNADGTDVEQLTENPFASYRHVALAPDDEWIVYTSCPDGYMHDCQLYKIRTDGSEQTHITESPGYNQYLSWSPDSQWFLFSSYSANSRNIYKMQAHGSDIELLAEGGVMGWSPDGEWIAFSYEYELYKMRPDGSDIERLTDAVNVASIEIIWSPDSEWILFYVSIDNHADLYRVRADGSDLQRLTLDGVSDAEFSPDGAWILYEQWNVDTDLYMMRADGSDVRRLTSTEANERSPSWLAPQGD